MKEFMRVLKALLLEYFEVSKRRNRLEPFCAHGALGLKFLVPRMFGMLAVQGLVWS